MRPSLAAVMAVITMAASPCASFQPRFTSRVHSKLRSSATDEATTSSIDPYSLETKDSTKSRTQRIMEKTSSSGQLSASLCQFDSVGVMCSIMSLTLRLFSLSRAGGAGGSSTYDFFMRTEQNWERLKSSKPFKYDSENSFR